MSNVELLDFDPSNHLPLLERWLHRPHVQRWWGDPELNLAQVCERPHGGSHALIATDDRLVGYLCWQRYSDEYLEILGTPDMPSGAIDVDIMIGEPSQVGCGVGPRALRLLLARLGGDPTVPVVGTCTSVHNTGAARAYEKAGFTRVREFEDPEWGRCWFMVADPRKATAQRLSAADSAGRREDSDIKRSEDHA